MNERYTVIAAALFADLSASVAIFLFAPSSPICAASSDLAQYLGEHTVGAAALWLLVFGVATLLLGSALHRQRQNLSTRFKFIACAGLIGILIDNIISVYQFKSSPDVIVRGTSSATLLMSLIVRSLIYAAAFAAVTAAAYMGNKNRRPVMTPPPRFGKE